MHRPAAAWLLPALTLALAACAPAGRAGGAARSPAASPAAASPSALATACTGAGATPAGRVWTVASGLDQPDDLLFHEGSLLVAVLGTGSIRVLTPGLPPAVLPVHIGTVEGMVYIGPDLYVAGQAADAVYQVSGDRLRTVIQLQPVPGQDGVDGIGAQDGLLVVPDSPRGVVDWVDPASGRIVKQAGGFVRPTGVWAAADGSLLVADEFGDAVVRLGPRGGRSYLVRNLPIADDVAEDLDGNVFVVTPAASGGRLVQVLPGGAVRDLADGLAAPQGLAVDGAGNLYLSEEDAGRVDLLLRSFKLVPPAAVATGVPTCIRVARAPGFGGAITLAGGPGLQVVEQPGAGGQGAVLVTGCRAAPCRLTASAGRRTDSIEVRAP